MKKAGMEQLDRELRARHDIIYNYLNKEEYSRYFEPPDIREAVYSYINLGGKSLRPSVTLFSCGAVGGDEEVAVPLAAAIEVYHTWTLVHDDIIDRDKKRRGGPTVHEKWYRKALDMGYNEDEARHYGQTIATITGDVQHAWAVSLLCELHTRKGLSPLLVLKLIHQLQTKVVGILLKGETLDVQYSKIPPDRLEESSILEMLWAKTGVLYEFAGQSGAMIGLNTDDQSHIFVNALASFASTCGLAFQLQDDVLGITGDEKVIGKPVGSDIREGKRTLILCHGFKNATKSQREKLTKTIGNRNAREEEIAEIVNILKELGSIDYTMKLARNKASNALSYLNPIPPSRYKDFLKSWASYITEREY